MKNQDVFISPTVKVNTFISKDTKIGDLVCKDSKRKFPFFMPDDGVVVYVNNQIIKVKNKQKLESQDTKKNEIESELKEPLKIEEESEQKMESPIKPQKKEEMTPKLLGKRPKISVNEVNLDDMFDDFFESHKKRKDDEHLKRTSDKRDNEISGEVFKDINQILGIKPKPEECHRKIPLPTENKKEKYLLLKYLECEHPVIFKSICTRCFREVRDMKPQLLADENGHVELRGEEGNQIVRSHYIKQKKMIMILDLDHTVVHSQFLNLQGKIPCCFFINFQN